MSIEFYRKNWIDLSYENPSITITDATATDNGQNYVNYLRNRDNVSGWATTGSNDAANTTIVVNFGDARELNKIILLQHNFKAFTIKYWNGSAWTDFSTPISETANAAADSYYSFDLVETEQIQIIISGTITADQDKFLKQLLLCEVIGAFTIEPEIEMEISQDKSATKFISGKYFVSKQVGGVEIRMRRRSVEVDADLTLWERLFEFYEGFHVSISGGATSVFENQRIGYRPQDIYFMQSRNEHSPNFRDGYYKHGMDLDLRLVEVN